MIQKAVAVMAIAAVTMASVPQIESKGLFDREAGKQAEQIVLSSRKEFNNAFLKQKTDVKVKKLKANAISVGTLKVQWEAEKDRDYEIEAEPIVPQNTDEELPEDYQPADWFVDNIYIDYKGDGLCYINGLRENTQYRIRITPMLKKGENKDDVRLCPNTICPKTEEVEVIWDDYEYIDGWTSCYCGERASGLTLNPSWGAIQGAIADPVTGTGIMRNEYGDYCVAMGVYYGYCNDRFLIELDNGIQFTVKICDSKGWADDEDGDGYGDGKFHWYGGVGGGKCIIEGIYADGQLPSCVQFSGSWGFYNWNGLNLASNIRSIKKINYGEQVEY